MLVGLLAVDPHRLYLYWELPGNKGVSMRLLTGVNCVRSSRRLTRSGGLYLTGLEPNRVYRAEFHQNHRHIASSNEASLPPDGTPRGAVTIPPALAPAAEAPPSSTVFFE